MGLVERLPKGDSPWAFELLWSGESAVFQAQLLEQLESAEFGAVGVPLEVLLRNSSDPFGISGRPRFGFAVCVSTADRAAARNILEKLLDQKPVESSIEASAIPFSAEEKAAAAELPTNWDSAAASVEVWAGTDQGSAQFIESSLHGVGVPTRRLAAGDGILRLMIRPEDEERGREIARQIRENAVPQRPLPPTIEYVWLDEPVNSYSLVWGLGGAYLLLCVLGLSMPGLSLGATALLTALVGLATLAANIGALWMLYQAVRYEIRPLRYCVLSIIPLSFVWYYYERYTRRQGVRRLPVAVRSRISPPSA